MYPVWMVLLCLLAGLIYGFTHYYGTRQFRDKGPWLKWVLFSLRTLAVTLIALLLLSPLLKYYNLVEENPVWVVAADNSKSLSMIHDSLELAALYRGLEENIEHPDADIDFVVFGEGLQYTNPSDADFSDRSTDLSEVISYINNTYDGRNLAGVLIASDGIYNRGANPIYTPIGHSAPIHFLALGDTTVRRDLILRRVLHNRVAYLGEKFSFQIDLSAQMANGASTELRVFSFSADGSSNLIHSEEVNIDSDDFFKTFEVVTEATDPGLQRYRVTASPIEGELSIENNSRDFYVEVMDNRVEVAIVGAAPHPDLGAIKTLLENYRNYDPHIYTSSNWDGDFNDYDILILHQLPGRGSGTQRVVQQALDSGKPLFFILGNQSNIQQFNQVQDILQITGGRNRQNDVVPFVNRDFNPFSFDRELYNRFRSFVPLSAPFGEYDLSPTASVLMHQRIGQVETDLPLLAMGEISDRRMAVLAGEGFWRWRLYEFSSFDDTRASSDVLQKTMQFLSVVDDDRRLRVYTDDNLYDENEGVIFEAEYYNPSYQRMNNHDLKLDITDESDHTFSYNFDRRDDHYILHTGPFSPGDYTYRAEVNTGSETFEARGGFTVRPIELEALNLQANHGLLQHLASAQNGIVFYPENIQNLNQLLFEASDLRPVVHSTLRTNLILNLFWICALLLVLLFGEWFLRRYFGSY